MFRVLAEKVKEFMNFCELYGAWEGLKNLQATFHISCSFMLLFECDERKCNSSLKVDRIACLVNTVISDTDKHR